MRAPTTDIKNRLYPDRALLGYSHRDGTAFLYRVAAKLLHGSQVILDYGAGRGQQVADADGELQTLLDLRNLASEVVAFDIAPAVSAHEYSSRQIHSSDGEVKLPDSSVDGIIADFVLEHLDSPDHAIAEWRRLLKPGGWFIARTPWRYSMVGTAARVAPNSAHGRILGALQPQRDEQDVFPTAYKLNTERQVQSAMSSWFDVKTVRWRGEPAYYGNSLLLARIEQTANTLFPSTLMIFAQRRAQ
jgi:SAM-dependent methyltransferase